jgi:cytochrome c oxidase subunit 3
MTHNPTIPAHHFENLAQQREAATVGMWVFLATEVLVFGALFTGYAVYHAIYPDAFAAGSRHLNALIGGTNTIVLLTSSLTMALAVHAAQTDRRRALVGLLIATVLLGVTFLGVKAVEYTLDFHERLVPGLAFDAASWTGEGVDPRPVQLFLMFYYIMTGVHALHMTVGIGVLTVLIVLAWRGRFGADRYMPVEISGLYWHFVDIIWIFLLPLLYLAGTRATLY